MPNETARLLYVIDTFIALAQTGMSTADALRLMARHAGQGTDESTGEATRFSTGRGYRRTGALFDARLVSRLESVVTAELAIPVNPGLRHAERLPADYLDTLFATLNRVARELGELRIRLAKYARDPSVTAVEQAVVKDVLVECATMLKSILSESQLFSRNEDQLHGFARSGRIGALITNVHPVFRQLAGGITVIETTITQLLVHREGEGSDHVLAELHRAAVDLAKVIHDAYREYLDATRTRALEAAA